MSHLAAACALASLAGCAPILYYGVPKTRTYEYERRVTIAVDSQPAGATVATADGKVLGRAPFALEERVRVRRKHRSHDPGRAVLGCALDFAAFAVGFRYWNDRQDDALAKVGLVLGSTALLQCGGLGIIKLINIGVDPAYRGMQAPPLFSSPTRTEEQVLSRTVELVGRWDGLPDARVKIELPAQRAATLRLDRRFTFDEARALWQRAAQEKR